MSNFRKIDLREICPKALQPYLDRFASSDVGLRLAKGAFWSLVGALVSRGLMLLASILIARELGREVYGEYGMIRSTVGMFVVFAGFGLGLTATKHVAEFRSSDPIRAGRIMAISGLFAVLTGAFVAVSVYITAPWLTAKTINAPYLTEELRIGAIILFLNSLNGAQTGALAGFEAFKVIAKVNLWSGVLSFPLLVGGAYWGGLVGAIWALVFNAAINWALSHLALRREAARFNVPFSVRECLVEWPTLWRFSLPAALSGIMVSPVIWVCNAMLVNQPEGYGQMGLFDAANQWRMAILFIPTMISQIALPILTNISKEYTREKYHRVVKYNLAINGVSALLVALPIIFMSEYIMSSYGSGFVDGQMTLILLAAASVFMSLNNVIGQVIASKGEMWVGFILNLIWALTIVALSYVFICKSASATSIAMACLLSYILHSIWQYLYVKFKLVSCE